MATVAVALGAGKPRPLQQQLLNKIRKYIFNNSLKWEFDEKIFFVRAYAIRPYNNKSLIRRGVLHTPIKYLPIKFPEEPII